MSETYALVLWNNENKKEFIVIKKNDIFLEDEDEELKLEEDYDFKFKKSVFKGTVKLIGSREKCEYELKYLNSKKLNSPVGKKVKKTKISSNQCCKKVENKSINNQKNNTQASPCIEKDYETQEKFSDIERKLSERDSLILDLENQLKDEREKNLNMEQQLEMFKEFSNQTLFSNMTKLSIQVLKYIGSEKDRDEVRKFGNNSGQILIHEDYPGKFMSMNLNNRIEIMISEQKNPEFIFRTMAKALVSDVEIWAKSNGKTMIEKFSELSAARDYLRSKNVNLTESKFKTVMRGLCSECKAKN